MKQKTFYIVQYNDCYGNGDNKKIEALLESEDEFRKWLKEWNKERKAMGATPENEEEFNLIPINLYNPKK